MNKAVPAFLIACAAGLGALIFMPLSPTHEADYYVTHGIMSPVPTTLRHVKTLHLFAPSLGDGACVAAYTISAADFDLLFQAHPWSDGFINRMFTPDRNFAAAWPGVQLEFESYHFRANDTIYVDMAVSRDHSKIIFFMPL